jgi:hypothetical protein
MSKWEEYQMESKIQDILDNQEYPKADHHLKRPFLSAYQIAIEYARRHRADFESFGMQIGGKGIGEHSSFSQYIGRELSRRLKEPALPNIEGGFFSNVHLNDIEFSSIDGPIHSSATEGQYPLSVFRSRRPVQ